MKFLPQNFPIASFGSGGFRFGDYSHLGSLLVLPSGMSAWNIGAVLKVEDFAQIAAAKADIDFVILGTGEAMFRPARAIMNFFTSENLNVEFMNTSSAIHSYNVMLDEGRRLAAAFMAVEKAAV
jgi:uncharacterized protein